MATTTDRGTEYTLAEASEMFGWPVEALLGVEYDDDRVKQNGRGQYDFSPNQNDDPAWLDDAWRELRRAAKRGVASPDRIRVRVRSVSRDVEGYVLI